MLERADTAEAIGLNQRASALLDHHSSVACSCVPGAAGTHRNHPRPPRPRHWSKGFKRDQPRGGRGRQHGVRVDLYHQLRTAPGNLFFSRTAFQRSGHDLRRGTAGDGAANGPSAAFHTSQERLHPLFAELQAALNAAQTSTRPVVGCQLTLAGEGLSLQQDFLDRMQKNYRTAPHAPGLRPDGGGATNITGGWKTRRSRDQGALPGGCWARHGVGPGERRLFQGRVVHAFKAESAPWPCRFT